ncbi:hypothetical protein C8Q80DRAFT_873835 [Daedaleopsis nitida]|nr:hypothetical protein C8Q80DRAFT_873835 [Daedaleopsis nitida]
MDVILINEPQLQSWTAFWRKRYDWLLRSGLEIRPEYRNPAAIRVSNRKMEEQLQLEYMERSLKAVRTTDGHVVSLSLVEEAKELSKVKCARKLASRLLYREHPRNHCAPLDILRDPYNKEFLIFVTPCLGKHPLHAFESVGEVMDFCRQLFEGLHFLHEQGVFRLKHPDEVVTFDAFRPLECDMMHRRRSPWNADRHGTHVRSRSYTAHPVKYFFDVPSSVFILDKSTRLSVKNDQARRLAATDDVKRLCNLIEGLMCMYTNLGFLEALVTCMNAQIEHRTPAIDEAMQELDKLISQLSRKQLRARAVPMKDFCSRPWDDFRHKWFHTSPNRLLRRNPVPTIQPKF